MTAGKRQGAGWVDPLLRPVAAASVPPGGVDVTVEPTAAERQALARALGLAEVEHCKASFRLAARSGGIVTVTGSVAADVKAVCVVTLQPFPIALREPVEMRFAETEDEPRRRAAPLTTITAVDLTDSDDPPDPIENGMIDLGKVTTEFMALALPIYPRAPDAAFPDEAGQEEAEASPFAALAKLKDGGS